MPLEHVFRIINELTGETAENPVGKVLQTGRIVGLANHTALIRRDGTMLSIEDSAAPIRGPHGAVSGVVMVFHDVTARRRAEVALAATQQRFRAVFDQAAAGIVVTDLEGRILEANPQFLQIAGRTIEELRAITISDVTHPVDVEAARVRMQQLSSGQIPQTAHEERYVRKDGSVVWSRTTATLLRNLVGEGDRLISIVENITERREAEAALRDTRIRLDAMLGAAEIGTWTWDVANDRVLVDSNLARMTGALQGTKVASPLQSFLSSAIHPDDRANVEAALKAALGNGERGYEVEYRILRPDGSTRWIVARGHAQFDASGAPVQLPGVALDITERKQAEEARSPSRPGGRVIR